MNQNATQIHCLFIHLPFIFASYNVHLDDDIWIVMESLLRCVEICFSNLITEDDIKLLETLIEMHLNLYFTKFDSHLLPKHHFMTHYPNAIRKMGPLIHFWMMRFESKHKYFTQLARSTNNYVNIAKTLAHKHQAMICHTNFDFDTIEYSKIITRFTKSSKFNEYKEIATRYFSFEG